MKGKLIPATIVLTVLLALSAGLSTAQGPAPQGGGQLQAMLGSAFTYQGQLQKDGSPIDATCAMTFTVYDDATAGNLLAGINANVEVSDGLFTVPLDFGSGIFTGGARWLEVAVQCPGDAAASTLTPRQALTAAPYALSLQPGAVIIGEVTGDPVLYVHNTAATGALALHAVGPNAVLGDSSAPNYTAVMGRNSATTGTGMGVYGEAYSTEGRGVSGYTGAASGTTYGVYGSSASTDGRGVFGYTVAVSGTTYGVYGSSESTDGTGVLGFATAFSGTTRGLYGYVRSSDGVAVYGRNTSTSSGVAIYGVGPNAVLGESSTPNYAAVMGRNFATTGDGMGVYGRSDAVSGYGVYGYTPGTFGTGVYGEGDTGVYGEGTYDGVQGVGSMYGVHGESTGNGSYGVLGFTGSDTGESYAIYGQTTSAEGWAGRFSTSYGNGVSISSNAAKVGLVVAGGTKSAVVATSQGARLLYTEESTEVWFTDYGFGQLVDGSATVVIDPLYAQTVNLEEPYHVFVQVYGDAEVYVSERTAQSFTVQLRAGDPAVEFSYRLVAKRLGFEDTRLEPAPWADDDPNLYPESGAVEP